MNKQIYKVVLSLILLILINTACTWNFKDYNTDPTGYTEELQKINNYWYGIPLMNVQQGIYFNYDWGEGKNWPFQIMQNLNVDLFGGYFHNYTFKDAAFTNTMYDLNDSWNAAMWEYTYWYIVPEGVKAESRNRAVIPEFYAIAKILKVELLHRISDVYGPILYRDLGITKMDGIPDSQEHAYYAFFDDLDEAIGILKENRDSKKFARFDFLMPDDLMDPLQWQRFANSLRLRLAMRISKKDPVKASEEVARALEIQNGGVLERTEEIVEVSTLRTGFTNPLGEINKSWGEVYMNANMESILTGYEDPRLSRFFETATDENFSGKFKGIRQGTGFAHEKYQGHSKSAIRQSRNATLMTAAEVWFLRAEAALRGWTDENVQTCYENGIKTSFAHWRADGIEEYLKNERKAADYIDAFEPAYNIKARCNVSPKWENDCSNEEKLEKIITQKWIANYPEGCEAWAEQRRTGYPRFFPVLINMSNGAIDTDIMIRRLNFPVNIKTSNPLQYESLCSELDGPDTGGTRLWWDVVGPNF